MPDQTWNGSPRAGNAAGITLLSLTELSGLVSGNVSVLSPAIPNLFSGAYLDLFMDVVLDVTFAAYPTNNSVCDLYIVRSVVGDVAPGDFEDGVGGASGTYILPPYGYVGSFKLRDYGATRQRPAIGFIEVPPRDHKFLLHNLSGQPFPTSGTPSVKAYYYRYQAL